MKNCNLIGLIEEALANASEYSFFMSEFTIKVTLEDNVTEKVIVKIPESITAAQLPKYVAKAVLEVSQLGVLHASDSEVSLIPPHRILKLHAKIPQIQIYSTSEMGKLIV